ncbi:hypothetical protein BDV25DRAFT_150933 [Aspergillus avenaceus]|uniref:Uncharacterized protein n=1 Tax=Aspergillus avenaceus TaxID=36643 RepID=A0A5N6U1K9_ASPAV|nr:hypothetical protein BDV25DRAFT_150933 [Aspergillus avenaceus]
MRSSPTVSESSLRSACQNMVGRWALAIAIIIVCSTCSLTMVCYGARGIVHPRPAKPGHRGCLHSRIGIDVQPCIYYALRYMKRLLQRLKFSRHTLFCTQCQKKLPRSGPRWGCVPVGRGVNIMPTLHGPEV